MIEDSLEAAAEANVLPCRVPKGRRGPGAEWRITHIMLSIALFTSFVLLLFLFSRQTGSRRFPEMLDSLPIEPADARMPSTVAVRRLRPVSHLHPAWRSQADQRDA